MILSFRIFNTLSFPNCKSWGAEILRERSPPTISHMSRVTLLLYFFNKVVELVAGGSVITGEGSVINGAYPVYFFPDKVVKLVGGGSVINRGIPSSL